MKNKRPSKKWSCIVLIEYSMTRIKKIMKVSFAISLSTFPDAEKRQVILGRTGNGDFLNGHESQEELA